MNPAALQRAGAGGGGGDYVEGEEVAWSFLCPPPPPTLEENLLVPLPYFRGRLKTVARENKTPWRWGPGPGERLGTGTARPAARVRCALNAAQCAAHTPSDTAVLLHRWEGWATDGPPPAPALSAGRRLCSGGLVRGPGFPLCMRVTSVLSSPSEQQGETQEIVSGHGAPSQ